MGICKVYFVVTSFFRKKVSFSSKKIYLSAICVSFSLACFSPRIALAEIAPAGHIVNVQATATYEISGQQYNASSKILNATIKQIYAFDVLLATPLKYKKPGEKFSFVFKVKNTGNGSDVFGIVPIQAEENDFNFLDLLISKDNNDNNVIDGDETKTTDGRFELDSGGSFYLIVEGVVPANARKGEEAKFDLSIISENDIDTLKRVTATVKVGHTPVDSDHIRITAKQMIDSGCDGKDSDSQFVEVLSRKVAPGECIRYQISANNISKTDMVVEQLSIKVPVPFYTTVVSKCYDIEQDPLCASTSSQGEAVPSFDHDDSSNMDFLHLIVTRIAKGEEASIEYTVKVNE